MRNRKATTADFLIAGFLFLLVLAVVVPFINTIAISFSTQREYLNTPLLLIPRKPTLNNYINLLRDKRISIGYLTSLKILLLGLPINLFLTVSLAYGTSRKNYPGKRLILGAILFTMLFNGGIVPSYIMWSQYFHIKNTIWALIFPTLLFNGFYIILYKNNFSSNIHPALVEAAKIDGAGELYIYFKVVLPLSLPILATIGLMVGLGYWNDWTNGLYYISNEKLYSIQQLLMKIMNNIQAMRSSSNAALIGTGAIDLPGTSIRMAMAVIGILPIMLIYPFVQKYFIGGITVGAVKG